MDRHDLRRCLSRILVPVPGPAPGLAFVPDPAFDRVSWVHAQWAYTGSKGKNMTDGLVVQAQFDPRVRTYWLLSGAVVIGVTLVGLPKDEGSAYLRKMFENTKLRVVDNKIHISEVNEIEKQTKYFRKMEKIEKSRRQSSLRNL